MPSLDEYAREQAILAEINAAGRVSVTALAAEYGVSTVTIRKDLEALERRALLRRVRGGAVGVGVGDDGGSFDRRLRDGFETIRSIARAAAPLVEHGDVIALDASTAGYYLARELLDRRDLVVVTNGLRVATLLMEQSSAVVMMPGGVLRRTSGAMVGPMGEVLAGRGRIDKGFFGAVGVSVDRGLLELAVEEAQAKQALVQVCGQVYGLVEGAAFGAFGLHSFAGVDRITGLCTDASIDGEEFARWAGLGVPVEVAPERR